MFSLFFVTTDEWNIPGTWNFMKKFIDIIGISHENFRLIRLFFIIYVYLSIICIYNHFYIFMFFCYYRWMKHPRDMKIYEKVYWYNMHKSWHFQIDQIIFSSCPVWFLTFYMQYFFFKKILIQKVIIQSLKIIFFWK